MTGIGKSYRNDGSSSGRTVDTGCDRVVPGCRLLPGVRETWGQSEDTLITESIVSLGQVGGLMNFPSMLVPYSTLLNYVYK